MVVALVWIQNEQWVERGEDFFEKYKPFQQKMFKDLVAGYTVAMGAKTFIQNGRTRLPFCKNIVFKERSFLPLEILDPEILVVDSCRDFCQTLHPESKDTIFIVGGLKIFFKCIDFASVIYVQNVNIHPSTLNMLYPFISPLFLWIDMKSICLDGKLRQQCRSLRESPENWIIDENYTGNYTKLLFKIHEEYQYLNQIKKILKEGDFRMDRTKIGTYSTFGAQMRYSLANRQIPILTTKHLAWEVVLEELLWFISGCTDSKKLEEKGVKIWKGNSSREFLTLNGFPDRREGKNIIFF